MSAWIVPKSHIDAMVSVAIERKWKFDDPRLGSGQRPIEAADGDVLGQILVDEVVASVSFRYPDDNVEEGELPGPLVAYYLDPYSYEPTRSFSAEEIDGLLGCYSYQSCEHPGWNNSLAKQFCDTLREQIAVDERPDDIPWGFEAEDVGYLVLNR